MAVISMLAAPLGGLSNVAGYLALAFYLFIPETLSASARAAEDGGTVPLFAFSSLLKAVTAVSPAKAGVQNPTGYLDSGFRRNDRFGPELVFQRAVSS